MKNEVKKKKVAKRKNLVTHEALEEVVLIGISGVMGSGKSTVAKELKNIFNVKYPRPYGTSYERCMIIPFSKALKNHATVLGWDGKKDARGRRLLQLLGTEVVRECIGGDQWIKMWAEDVRAMYNKRREPGKGPRLIVIVDDVRFKNEREFIKQYGGIMIGLTNGPVIEPESVGIRGHASESAEEMLNCYFDFEIENSGDMDSLTLQVDTLFLGIQTPDEKIDASNYVELAIRTESIKTLADFDIQISEKKIRMLHAGLGLGTEAGEFLDSLKKHIFYDADLNQGNLIEELGDVLWYVAVAADALDVSMEEIMKRNIKKLKVRYPEKFTSDKALNRDFKAEGEIMEDPCDSCPDSYSDECIPCKNFKEDGEDT